MVRGKKDERGKAAARWLRTIDVQRLLCCAVQADMADEVMVFLRFLDTETYDVAELSARLSQFLSRVYRMAGPERQVLHVPGYTSLLLAELDGEPLVFTAPGGVRSIESPSAEDIDAVFQRFTGWLKLLKATCDRNSISGRLLCLSACSISGTEGQSTRRCGQC